MKRWEACSTDACTQDVGYGHCENVKMKYQAIEKVRRQSGPGCTVAELTPLDRLERRHPPTL